MKGLCPKCNRIVTYDPYFKVDVCRQCGWMGEACHTSTSDTRKIAKKYIIKKELLTSK